MKRTSLFTAVAGVVLLSSGSVRAQDTAASEVRVEERTPLTFRFSGEASVVRPVDVEKFVEAVVEDNTSFKVIALNETNTCVDDIRKGVGRLTCLAKESSPKWDALHRNKTYLNASFGKLRRALKEDPGHADYLLIVTSAKIEEQRDRFVALLIDVPAALEQIFNRYQSQKASTDPYSLTEEQLAQIEGDIINKAVRVKGGVREVTQEQDVQSYMSNLIERELRGELEQQGKWQPYEDIRLTLNAQDTFEVIVDGVSYGDITGSGLIKGVFPGEHRIELRNEQYLPVDSAGVNAAEATVMVAAGQTAALELQVQPRGSDVAPIVRQILIYSGAVAAAVGAGILAFGIERGAGGHPRRAVCIGVEDSCQGTPEWVRFGGGEEGLLENPNGSGPPIAPLGYSLMGMGLTWSLMTLLVGDDEDIPWIQALAGAAVFGAAFGISVAADGTNGVCKASGC